MLTSKLFPLGFIDNVNTDCRSSRAATQHFSNSRQAPAVRVTNGVVLKASLKKNLPLYNEGRAQILQALCGGRQPLAAQSLPT